MLNWRRRLAVGRGLSSGSIAVRAAGGRGQPGSLHEATRLRGLAPRRRWTTPAPWARGRPSAAGKGARPAGARRRAGVAPAGGGPGRRAGRRAGAGRGRRPGGQTGSDPPRPARRYPQRRGRRPGRLQHRRGLRRRLPARPGLDVAALPSGCTRRPGGSGPGRPAVATAPWRPAVDDWAAHPPPIRRKDRAGAAALVAALARARRSRRRLAQSPQDRARPARCGRPPDDAPGPGRRRIIRDAGAGEPGSPRPGPQRRRRLRPGRPSGAAPAGPAAIPRRRVDQLDDLGRGAWRSWPGGGGDPLLHGAARSLHDPRRPTSWPAPWS